MTGTVNADLEPIVRLDLLDANGQILPVDAAVDSGFDGQLALPPQVIGALGVPQRGRLRILLGDGSVQYFNEYDVTVIWDGQPRVLRVPAVGIEPLIGMELLRDHDLKIEVVVGGSVTILPRPTP